MDAKDVLRISTSFVESAAFIEFGALGALAFFGLLLGLLWGIPKAPQVSYKAITLLIVTGLSFTAGGFFSGMLASRKRVRHGLIFGLLFGTCSFTYLLGISYWVPVAAIAASLLGGLGGWISTRARERSIRNAK